MAHEMTKCFCCDDGSMLFCAGIFEAYNFSNGKVIAVKHPRQMALGLFLPKASMGDSENCKVKLL